MSLQLRQLCQPKLDGMGLSKYHVRIENKKYHQRCMLIVGECGKTLTTISGIEFSRNNPVKAEIDYAAELLEAFLIKHGVDIKAFVQAINTRPKDPCGEDNIYSFGGYVKNQNDYDAYAVQYQDGPFTLMWSEGTLYIYSTKTVPFLEVVSFETNTDLLKGAKQASKQIDAFTVSQNNINALKETLSKCEI